MVRHAPDSLERVPHVWGGVWSGGWARLYDGRTVTYEHRPRVCKRTSFLPCCSRPVTRNPLACTPKADQVSGYSSSVEARGRVSIPTVVGGVCGGVYGRGVGVVWPCGSSHAVPAWALPLPGGVGLVSRLTHRPSPHPSGLRPSRSRDATRARPRRQRHRTYATAHTGPHPPPHDARATSSHVS